MQVFPMQRVCVRFEVAIRVAGRGAQQGVERLKLALITLRHKVTFVTDTLCVSHNFSKCTQALILVQGDALGNGSNA